MDGCCELHNVFHKEEVEFHGKENNNLDLRLAPPGEGQKDRRYACDGGQGDKTGDIEHLYGWSCGSGERTSVLGRDIQQYSLCSQTQKRTRTSNTSAVGWPPIGSFRKNITSSSLRKEQAADPERLTWKEVSIKDHENPPEHTFVKVYMDGYPIGRKVDLRAYDSYEKLSSVINELFKGLLAVEEIANDADEVSFVKQDARAPKEEYTLVYEDNEGDRILVGDVPWNMFASSAKKLCILKISGTGNGRKMMH